MNLLNNTLRGALLCAVLPLFADSSPAVAAGPLGDYYIYVRVPGVGGGSRYSTVTTTPPSVRNVGGGVDAPADVTSAGSFYSIDRFVQLYASALEPNVLLFSWARAQRGACRFGYTRIEASLVAPGSEIQQQALWIPYEYSSVPGGYTYNVDPLKNDGPCQNVEGIVPPATWITQERTTFGSPQRRRAIDGGQYDASPMAIVRSGQPWMTYHWGYRLGLVASTANWDAANLSKVPELATWPNFPDAKDNFELVTLPPPWIENDVVEYANRADFPAQPGGQYFYTALASDKALLDSIPAWQRSGKSFKSGGYVSACRFYGGKNGGPNTHFYSADDKECTALKAIPALSYEGQTFAVNVPLPGAVADGVKPCPIDSKPLYRVYNNASASNGRFVSNHRYLTERADVAAVVSQGWVDEGQVMCVPL